MARFSKSLVLKLLQDTAALIAKEQNFDRSNGTAQLRRGNTAQAETDRAVQYGRMRAMEEVADAILDGF